MKRHVIALVILSSLIFPGMAAEARAEQPACQHGNSRDLLEKKLPDYPRFCKFLQQGAEKLKNEDPKGAEVAFKEAWSLAYKFSPGSWQVPGAKDHVDAVRRAALDEARAGVAVAAILAGNAGRARELLIDTPSLTDPDILSLIKGYYFARAYFVRGGAPATSSAEESYERARQEAITHLKQAKANWDLWCEHYDGRLLDALEAGELNFPLGRLAIMPLPSVQSCAEGPQIGSDLSRGGGPPEGERLVMPLGHRVNFDLGSDALSPDESRRSIPLLVSNAASLLQNHETVFIQGHTDRTCPKDTERRKKGLRPWCREPVKECIAFNQDLSQRRASTVKALMLQMDPSLDATRLIAEGKGMFHNSITMDDPCKGAEVNRRVELVAVKRKTEVAQDGASDDRIEPEAKEGCPWSVQIHDVKEGAWRTVGFGEKHEIMNWPAWIRIVFRGPSACEWCRYFYAYSETDAQWVADLTNPNRAPADRTNDLWSLADGKPFPAAGWWLKEDAKKETIFLRVSDRPLAEQERLQAQFLAQKMATNIDDRYLRFWLPDSLEREVATRTRGATASGHHSLSIEQLLRQRTRGAVRMSQSYWTSDEEPISPPSSEPPLLVETSAQNGSDDPRSDGISSADDGSRPETSVDENAVLSLSEGQKVLHEKQSDEDQHVSKDSSPSGANINPDWDDGSGDSPVRTATCKVVFVRQ